MKTQYLPENEISKYRPSDGVKDYLALVSRPSRYIGGEINSTKKDLSKNRLKFGLAFPDVYEIGMSHLGMQILYQILNSRPDIACERVFSPWVDMERLLRERQIPLATLESGIPLNELDVLGFSIQYELSYTNILNILNLGNIPLYSKERNERHPLIIGGGPVAFNPEPIADFFDIFVLGDGEEVILEIADCIIEWKNTRKKREDLFKRLAKIEGVYVPSFFDVKYHADGRIREITPLVKDYECVNKRIVADINALSLPTRPVVPFPQIVHDHLSVEINRGCTRGCRFCQAGMIYRPNRERSPENIAKWIEEALKNTGYDEVSFLSLSAGDYTCIEDVLIGFMDRFADKKIAVSLPSLRVGTLSPRLIEEIKKVRKTGFTMAPEAGSERLRNVINKGIREEALIETARNAFEAGWRAIKLYYMTGLPTETVDDIRGIVELSSRVQDAGRRFGFRPTVNVSVSQFVPKPHTPFQWEPQIRLEDSLERQSFLKQELKKKRLDFKWHDAKMSFLEGVFSRGDRRLAGVIKTAFDANCRFDSWGEQFRFDVWGKIFKDAGIDPEFYAYRRREQDEIFPWQHLNARVDKEFLYKEYERSLRIEETPDCKPAPAGSKQGTDKCSACGVCDHKIIKNVSSKQYAVSSKNQKSLLPTAYPLLPTHKIRLSFAKTGEMKYLGHLEMAMAFYRAIRRADIPIAHSLGFHPLPKIIFGRPLPVGIESIAENADIELKEHMKPENVLQTLNSVMPHGIKILTVRELLAKNYTVSQVYQEATYLVFLEQTHTSRWLTKDDENSHPPLNPLPSPRLAGSREGRQIVPSPLVGEGRVRGAFSGQTHTSLRLTKEDENNPPIPPLEKGGKGGFEAFSEQSSAVSNDRDTLEALISGFMEKDEVIIVQEREGKKRHLNIRPLIKELSLFDEKTIQLTLGIGEKGSVKPHEVMAQLLGLSQDDSRLLPILKINGEIKTITQIKKADCTDKEKIGLLKSV